MQGRVPALRARLQSVAAGIVMMMLGGVATAQSEPPANPPPMREIMRAPIQMMAPQMIGPKCESARLSAPDNQCVAYSIQTRGTGRDAQVSAQLRCNWDGQVLEEEIMRIFTSDGVSMRWVDATHLELTLPVEAHFTPPREQSTAFGRTIHYTYRHAPVAEMNLPKCLEAAPNPMRARVLNGPEKRRANAPGWVAYEIERACWMIGSSAAGSPAAPVVVTTFMQDSTPRLPNGTTDLVLQVSAPTAESGAPQIRLASGDVPIALQPAQGQHNYQIVGSEATRVLQRLAKGGGAQVSFAKQGAGTAGVAISREQFAEAYKAFQQCVHSSGKPAGK